MYSFNKIIGNNKGFAPIVAIVAVALLAFPFTTFIVQHLHSNNTILSQSNSVNKYSQVKQSAAVLGASTVTKCNNVILENYSCSGSSSYTIHTWEIGHDQTVACPTNSTCSNLGGLNPFESCFARGGIECQTQKDTSSCSSIQAVNGKWTSTTHCTFACDNKNNIYFLSDNQNGGATTVHSCTSTETCTKDGDSAYCKASSATRQLPACNVLNHEDPGLQAHCAGSPASGEFVADGYICTNGRVCVAKNIGNANVCEAQGADYKCATSQPSGYDLLPVPFSCGADRIYCYRKTYSSPLPSYPVSGGNGGNSGGGGGGGYSAPVPPTGSGYCADGQRNQADQSTAIPINNPQCSLNNATSPTSTNDYCLQQSQLKYQNGRDAYFYTCNTNTGSGSGTVAPAPQGPTTGPCQGVMGGVDTTEGQNGFMDSFCNDQLFDQTKANNQTFCGNTYTEKWYCKNINPATGTHYIDNYKVPTAQGTCNAGPWCPSTTTPVSQCTAYQGQSCNAGTTSPCCLPNQNLVCIQPPAAASGITLCEYNTDPKKGPVGQPTPTPGSANNCDSSNSGNWGPGCACASGGGCGPQLGCYPAADSSGAKTTDNPNGYYCAPVAQRWCQQTQTSTSTPNSCSSGQAYASPTPTPTGGPDLSWQNACPANGTNSCLAGSSCPSTMSTIGGTDGGKACTYFKNGGNVNGSPYVCCAPQTGASPAPGSNGGNSGGSANPVVSTAPVSKTPVATPTDCSGGDQYVTCAGTSTPSGNCTTPNGTSGSWQYDGKSAHTSCPANGSQEYCYICR